MRDIRFRAKKFDSNEWIYGSSPVEFKGNDGPEWWMLRNNRTTHQVEVNRIKPETCGQFTEQFLGPAALDLAWEGDIVSIVAEDGRKNYFVIRYGIASRTMDTGWKVDIPCFYFDLVGGDFKAFPIVKNYLGKHDLSMMEKRGNIHDNPELLK